MQEDKDKEVYKSKITWLGKEVKEEDKIEEDAEEEEFEEIMVFSSDEDVAERRLLEIGLPMEGREEEEMESKGPFKRKTTGWEDCNENGDDDYFAILGESSFPTDGLTPADIKVHTRMHNTL